MAQLRNLGVRSANWLKAVGIDTVDDLRQVGALAAFIKVEEAGFMPSLNLLWALEGALHDRHWTNLEPDHRATLLLAVDAAREQRRTRRHTAGSRVRR